VKCAALLAVLVLALVACGEDASPQGGTGTAATTLDDAPSSAAAAAQSESDAAETALREDRPRVDTRARLDVTGVPSGVTLEMDGYPIAGVLILPPGPQRLVVHGGGTYLRTITVELRVGETVTPELGWVAEDLAAERRHEAARRAGTCKCQKADEHGIAWLVEHRSSDGAWRADSFLDACPDATSCGGAVIGVSPIETTSLALLALIGIGETHHQGDYRSAVRQGVDFLLAQQSDDGTLTTAGVAASTRVHAIGTLALSELMVMTGGRRYREAAQRAVDALLARRRPGFGWSAAPGGGRPDAETTCWAAFVVSSARAAELMLPEALREDLAEDLSVFGDPGGTSLGPRLSAMLTLAWIAIGAPATHPRVVSGLERVLASPPAAETPLDPAFAWFGACVVFQSGGKEAWKKWSRSLVELVSDGFTTRLGLMNHQPDAESAPAAVELGRLRATIYRQLTHEVVMRYGRVFGVSER
jgi:hypothetical protein